MNTTNIDKPSVSAVLALARPSWQDISSRDAAWALCHVPLTSEHREVLEACITSSADAARVLVGARVVADRAALEARLISADAAVVLVEARVVADRAALESRVTCSDDAARVLRHAPYVVGRARLERVRDYQ